MTAITSFEEEIDRTPLTGVTWSRQRRYKAAGWEYYVSGNPPVAKLDGYPRVAK